MTKLFFAAAFLAASLPLTTLAGADSLSYRLSMPPVKGEPSLNWGKDPFIPAVKGEGADQSGLKLTAVFYGERNPSAIINDRIVYKGSLIAGQKVIDIGFTHVILQGDRGRVRLELSEIPELQDAKKKE